jgi:hypothetical protein
MRFASCVFGKLFAALLLCALLNAQQSAMQSSTSVPRLVSYAGRALDAQGKPIAATVGATFAIYKEQSEGAPLWLETQNLQTDARGNYSVQLGATKPEGLPLELFSAGESRWLGVRLNGGEEQARVLLLSVPYALKAADAETVGGLPASAFLLAAATTANATATATSVGANSVSTSAPPSVSGTGATDFVPLWLNTTGSLGNSVLFQSGTGATAKIGINTTTPATTLDVVGGTTVRGTLSLPATGNATASAGKNSQPLNLAASAFNKTIGTPVKQAFQWQAEPIGNNTATTGGSLNLLYASGSNPPAETGFKVASNGRIAFAAGQTFPGTGTATSVGLSAPSSDFTVSGSPVTHSGTFALNWTVPPTSADTASAIVKRDGTGSFSAGTISAVGVQATSEGQAVIGTMTLSQDNIAAVTGAATASGDSGFTFGVLGTSASNQGRGVVGQASGNAAVGVIGEIVSGGTGIAVLGKALPGSNGTGVWGESDAAAGANGFGPDGVDGISHNGGGSGVFAFNDSTGDALAATNQSGGFAAFFNGDVDVDGNLSKAAGSFKIDDPVDPANKYLFHSFVESPDMMNIYNGNVVTDAEGNAVIMLPDWFEALNRDFRYQLTVVGQFSQAIVASKVANHQFSIKTDKPNVEVSWQVTGIRQDAWANAHRIPVEVSKPQSDRGLYLHPELFGAPTDKSIALARHPIIQKLLKQKAATLTTTK